MGVFYYLVEKCYNSPRNINSEINNKPMDIQHHTQPQMLEKYSFLWSEARLVIAAIALFLGGVPPIWYIIKAPVLWGLTSSLLTICWLISGAAAIYLLYLWNQNRQTVFGGKDQKDTWAFFISIVSGINLGLAGLIRRNIGMSISSNRIILLLVGLLYLAVAGYLYNRWSARGQKLF